MRRSSLVLLVLLAGCLRPHIAKLGPEYPPLPATASVDVFVSEAAPVIAFERIGAGSASEGPSGAVLVGKVEIPWAGTEWQFEGVVEKAKREARELGGDVLVIGAMQRLIRPADLTSGNYLTFRVLRRAGVEDCRSR